MRNKILNKDQVYDLIDRLIKKNLHSNSKSGLLLALSIRVIMYFLGNEWIDKNIDKNSKFKLKKSSVKFFKTDELNIDSSRNKYFDRVISFGELIYNLHNIEGFNEKIDFFKNDDIQSLLSELEIGGFLYRNNYPFKFVIPKGVKKYDYDIEFKLKKEIICCEVKYKDEDTKLLKKSFLNSLNDAKKQLPKEFQNFICIKIPEKWILDNNSNKIINEGINDFFNKTNRIITIILFWEEWYKIDDNKYFSSNKFKEFLNKKSEILNTKYIPFFKYTSLNNFSDWFRFHDIIEKKYKLLQ